MKEIHIKFSKHITMNLAGNNKNYQYTDSQQNFTLAGNDNALTLIGCNVRLTVTGNGNKVSIFGGQSRMKVMGNGNIVKAMSSKVEVGVHGNGNQLEEDDCQFKVIYSNGYGNKVPEKKNGELIMQRNQKQKCPTFGGKQKHSECEMIDEKQQGGMKMPWQQYPPHPKIPPPCFGFGGRHHPHQEGWKNRPQRNKERNKNPFNSQRRFNPFIYNQLEEMPPPPHPPMLYPPPPPELVRPPRQRQRTPEKEKTLQGLSETELNRIPKSTFEGKSIECSVCWVDIESGQQITYLPCFHAFHGKCMAAWLKKSSTCPLCQLDIRQHIQ